jgi:hypothetical protein
VIFICEECIEAGDNHLSCAVQELTASVLKTRVQKLVMRKRRQRLVNQIQCIVNNALFGYHPFLSSIYDTRVYQKASGLAL